MKYIQIVVIATLGISLARGQTPNSEVLNVFRFLQNQNSGFSGEMTWTVIHSGSSVDILKMEELKSDEAYDFLLDGKTKIELTNGFARWNKITSTSLVQEAKIAEYESTYLSEINKGRATKISASMQGLNSDWNSDVAISEFNFENKRVETITSAGMHLESILEDKQLYRSIVPTGSLESLLNSFPNPLKLAFSASTLHAIILEGKWSDTASGSRLVQSVVDNTTYTILLNEKSLPLQIVTSRIVEGGWEQIVTFSYFSWKNTGVYWVPQLVTEEVSANFGSVSTTFSKNFIVCENFIPVTPQEPIIHPAGGE